MKIEFLADFENFEILKFHFWAQKTAKNREKPPKTIFSQSVPFGLQNIKNGHINSQKLSKSDISYVNRSILPKPIKTFKYRFGCKKAQKIQKFLNFQNLQDLSFLSIYTLLGVSQTQKNIWNFEFQCILK